MKYLSVCSGIEAATQAWHPLGWEAVGFSEIEPFPAAVLKHHYPQTINYGDMTKYEQWNIPSGAIDLLVGGTPCQAFSVAGVRGGLDDPRGGLTLTFVRMADHFNPKWVVWENVPGVLSSKDNAFGCFLGALSGESCELKPTGDKWTDAGCVYGPKRTVVWRCLDAQYFGLAQRRKRVFVVACPRDQGDPSEILLEFEGLRRDTAPSREKREGVASNVAPSLTASNNPSRSPQSSEVTAQVEAVHRAIAEREVVGCLSDGAHMGGGLTGRTHTPEELWQSQIAETLMATDYKGPGHNRDHNFITEPIVIDRAAFNQVINAQYKPSIKESQTMDSLVARGPHAVAIPIHDQATRHAGKHGDKSDGKGNGLGVGKPGDPCPTPTKGDKHAVLYENHPNDSRVTGPHDVAPSCVSRYGTGGGNVPLVQAVDVYNQTIDGDVAATLTKAVGGTNTSGAKVMAFKPRQSAKARSLGAQSDIACTFEAGDGGNNKQAIAFEPGIATREGNESRFVEEMSPTLRKDMGDNQVAVADRMAVRRLTPRECERLQGFPDDYTMIPWRGKPADQCPDGPRYKALGNSMAVPCMAWIGKRIDEVDRKLTKENTK